MQNKVQLKNGVNLILEGKPFANGGEGSLYKVLEPVDFQKFVVKIYNSEKLTTEKEKKILHLAANSPFKELANQHSSISWPTEPIYSSGKFIGFAMQFAKGEKLEFLCHRKKPKQLNAEWDKFDFQQADSLDLRLKLCFNIAVAIYQIHKTKGYVLIDLKPENILVQSNGLISIIDLDSVAVIENQVTIYPGTVVTPEYTPPEQIRESKIDWRTVDDTWDRFSLAVILYRVLCGIHPFSGTSGPPFENCTTLAKMIENGLYVHGPNEGILKMKPIAHANFKYLESDIQELFFRCFVNGHKTPQNRPEAEEWCRAFSPTQKREHNRPLPSNAVYFPAFKYTQEQPPPAISRFEFPKPNFEEKHGIIAFVNRLFSTGEKKILENSIRVGMRELLYKLNKKGAFDSAINNIQHEYLERQKNILSNEKLWIEELKRAFNARIKELDDGARKLHNDEGNEIRLTIAEQNKINSNLNEQLRNLYFKILGSKMEQHDIRKGKLQEDKANLSKLEQYEINAGLNDPNKLSKYRIYSGTIHNIGHAMVDNLAHVGIVTAADFTDYGSDGWLKNKYGKWVKASGIGWSRAYDLVKWRNEKEAIENKKITQKVKGDFESRFETLRDAISKLEMAFIHEMKPFHAEYSREKTVIDQLKYERNALKKSKIAEISSKYDNHESRLSELATGIGIDMQLKLMEVAKTTGKELENSRSQHETLSKMKMQEINEFIKSIELDITNLVLLQERLNQLRGKSK